MKRFSLLLARCTGGVDSGGENSPVPMAFVLTGSIDARQFHPRALMAIAEITSAPHFDSMWMKCRNADELRDPVLLAQRRRETVADV